MVKRRIEFITLRLSVGRWCHLQEFAKTTCRKCSKHSDRTWQHLKHHRRNCATNKWPSFPNWAPIHHSYPPAPSSATSSTNRSNHSPKNQTSPSIWWYHCWITSWGTNNKIHIDLSKRRTKNLLPCMWSSFMKNWRIWLLQKRERWNWSACWRR